MEPRKGFICLFPGLYVEGQQGVSRDKQGPTLKLLSVSRAWAAGVLGLSRLYLHPSQGELSQGVRERKVGNTQEGKGHGEDRIHGFIEDR